MGLKISHFSRTFRVYQRLFFSSRRPNQNVSKNFDQKRRKWDLVRSER